MKNLYFYLPFVFLIAVFSCKKDDLSNLDVTNSLKSKNTGTRKHPKAALQDTTAPAGAVNVKTYGATGDGVHDDTQAIQNAINAQTVLVLTKGTYIINSTLNLRSGVSIYGSDGATIQAGPAMNGSLSCNGRCFYLNSVSRCAIINLKFLPSVKSYNVAAWSNAVIMVNNSSSNTIEYNTMTFKQSYNPNGINGIWISGTTSTYNYVGYNKLTTMGIEYAEAGASYNTVTNNTITTPFADGLSAHGNASTFCTNNSVLNNTVTNSGQMGIEDWGSITGSVIKGNTINGTGKNTSQSGSGIGLSLVGVNSVASHNIISNAQDMYIEVGGNNNIKVDTNTINDTQLAITGIIVNCTTAKPAGSNSYSATINGNNITGCEQGIAVQGDESPNATVSNNVLTNQKWMALNLNTNSGAYNVTFTGNAINFTNKSTQARRGVEVYTSSTNSGQKTTVTSNTITYATSANGGSGCDMAFSLEANYINYTGNKVVGNKVKSGGSQVFAISASGNAYKGITYNNNVVSGATVDLSNLSLLSNLDNIVE